MQTLVRLLFFLVISIFSVSVWAEKKAQVLSPDVDVYSAADFDSEVIDTIQPGVKYQISNKPKGPFYLIRLKNGKIGYVPDTELDIEGEGPFQPKPFKSLDNETDEKSTKKIKSKKNTPPEDEDEDPEAENMTFHEVSLQLINYHEDTLGGTQIGDLYAVGYRHLPLEGDYGSGFSWDVTAAFNAPAYYKELTGQSASGFAFWSGFQIVNISDIGPNTTLHYGAGPFAKFTQFEVRSSTRGYSLQDLTVGVSLDAGLIFHFAPLSFDLGLKYFLDKKSYGALTLGVLF